MVNSRKEALLELRLASGEAAERLEEMERVIKSNRFSSCGKKSKMLRFVVEEVVLGHEVKEVVVGTQIFKSGYDPGCDSHVRVAAGEIRDMLREYYRNEGESDPLQIDLPVGCYTPVFTHRPLAEAVRPDEIAAMMNKLLALEEENSVLRQALREFRGELLKSGVTDGS